MARFRYLGEPPQGWGTPGMLKIIRVPQKDGTMQELLPVPPATYFPVGEDIGYDISDERSLRCLRVDTRYEEIIT